MSWVWKADQRLRTPEQVMAVIIQVVDELTMPDKRGAAICAGMCVAQESDFWCPWNAADPESKNCPYDSQSDDGRSVGYFQQQKGPDGALWWGTTASEMDLHSAAREFLTRLKKVGYNASNAQAANDAVQAVQRSGVPQGYKKHWDRINDLYNRVSTNPPEAPVADNKPAYNEYPMWSPSNSPRNGKKVDLFLLHTQEGDGTADSLARFLGNGANQVSYHYTVDNAGNVVDVVDTDDYSWSVLSANSRSINLCFAGSRAAWSRQQWLDNMGRAIDIAAYLAVQDCKKYGISTNVITPPYNSDPPGISDHRYVTQHLRDGTHTDVGDGFPWDVFIEAINKYANPQAQPQPGAPVPDRQFPKDFTDRELLEWIVNQLGPGDPSWPSKGMTLRDKVWAKDAS